MIKIKNFQAQIVKLIRCLKKKNGEIAGLSGENDRLQGKNQTMPDLQIFKNS